MNDFEVTAAVPPGIFELPRLSLVAPRTHPAPPLALRSRDSGPARTREFRRRLQRSDLAIVSGVATLASLIPLIAVPAGLTPDNALRQAAIIALIVMSWTTALWLFRTRDSRVLCVGVTEYKRIVSSSTMTFGILGITFVLVPVESARWYFLLSLPLGVFGLLLDRWLWRKWLVRQSEDGSSLSRVVVVGTRAEVEYIVRQVRKGSAAAYSVIGAVIEGASDRTRALGIPVWDDLDNVAAHVAALGADAVIVAGTPSGRGSYVHDLAWALEGSATELILATNLVNVAGPRIHLRPVEGLPLIHVEIPQFEGGKHALKRVFDILTSGAALVALAPVLGILAALVMLDSPGPALFRQVRVGRDGSTFTMFKFRSMAVDAEAQLDALRDRNEGAGALFKIRNDPRVTRFGAFMRKHSLDELPQLWNILIGDMSVVGPRPPLPREVTDYEDHVHRRLYIRPGLTGMWQVNGRSTLDWESSVQLDLYYVENWSLVGDLVIIWRTFRELRQPVGAF